MVAIKFTVLSKKINTATLPETNIAPKSDGFQARNLLYLGAYFQVQFASFREAIYSPWSQSMFSQLLKCFNCSAKAPTKYGHSSLKLPTCRDVHRKDHGKVLDSFFWKFILMNIYSSWIMIDHDRKINSRKFVRSWEKSTWKGWIGAKGSNDFHG